MEALQYGAAAMRLIGVHAMQQTLGPDWQYHSLLPTPWDDEDAFAAVVQHWKRVFSRVCQGRNEAREHANLLWNTARSRRRDAQAFAASAGTVQGVLTVISAANRLVELSCGPNTADDAWPAQERADLDRARTRLSMVARRSDAIVCSGSGVFALYRGFALRTGGANEYGQAANAERPCDTLRSIQFVRDLIEAYGLWLQRGQHLAHNAIDLADADFLACLAADTANLLQPLQLTLEQRANANDGNVDTAIGAAADAVVRDFVRFARRYGCAPNDYLYACDAAALKAMVFNAKGYQLLSDFRAYTCAASASISQMLSVRPVSATAAAGAP